MARRARKKALASVPREAAPQASNRAREERGGSPNRGVTVTRAVRIYTDGACKGNPGPGGWGALLQFDGRIREMFGGEAHTTNNRMELTAVIEALSALKRPCTVAVYTDSQYVKNGIQTWIHGWKRNGWKTADRKPVKNADLWQQLDLPRAPSMSRLALGQGARGDPGQCARRRTGESRRRLTRAVARSRAASAGSPSACRSGATSAAAPGRSGCAAGASARSHCEDELAREKDAVRKFPRTSSASFTS